MGSGQPALEPWSHCHIYDHTQPLVRQYWTDMCLNMTATGVIDGCGADFSAMEQNSWKYHTASKIGQELGLDDATAVAWAAGHRQMMHDTTAALGDGLLVGKDSAELGDHVNAALHEGCSSSNGTITLLLNLTARARAAGQRWVYQCHSSRGANTNTVAAFLTGAGDGHYFAVGGWNNPSAASHWSELFERPLGEPVSDPTYDHGTATWTRAFRSGTKVSFNAQNNTGTIDWSS